MIQKKLRSDLQTRKNRVLRANDSTFALELKGFFDFLNSKPILKGLREELDLGRPVFTNDNVLEIGPNIPGLEIPRLKHCLGILDYCAGIEEETELENFLVQLCYNISENIDIKESLNLFRDIFFLPFYEYLDEHVEDYGIVLYLLHRFKFRTETFDRDYMQKLYESDPKRSESLLDKEVRKFLFDQGLDYPLSTPLSPSGRSDIVADLHTEDPLVLEVKILDLDRNGYDKSYIRQGFKQIFDYANDYNKSVGYLLIFNASEVDLTFNLKNKSETRIELGGKTFHIVVVNIYPETTPSSKKGKLKPYMIEESFLVSRGESGAQSQ
jgi:hypothetical protein